MAGATPARSPLWLLFAEEPFSGRSRSSLLPHPSLEVVTGRLVVLYKPVRDLHAKLGTIDL